MSFVIAGTAIVGAGIGIAKAFSGAKDKRRAEREQAASQAELAKQKAAFSNLDTSNPFTGMTNQFAGQENTMEDLTINQKGMELQNQQGQQQRANILDQMKGSAGGSGVAALAQQMANSGQLASQESAKTIGDQEAANQKATVGEASRLQTQEAQGATNLQNKMGEGEMYSRDAKSDQVSTLLGMEQSNVAGAKERVASADAAKWEGISSIGSSITNALSDRRLKKNIELVGNSPSGVGIYNFEYIDNSIGEGYFQGAMSDEVPSEAVSKHSSGYEMVDYSKIDVEFKNIN